MSLQVKHQYKASAERVFDAWFDEKSLGRWLFSTDTGEVTHVEVDARIGGKIVVIEKRGEEDAKHYCELVEIDRPKRIAFLFALNEDGEDATKVSIDIKPDGTGCSLTLTHDGVDKENVERTEKGWSMILGNLDKVLTEF